MIVIGGDGAPLMRGINQVTFAVKLVATQRFQEGVDTEFIHDNVDKGDALSYNVLCFEGSEKREEIALATTRLRRELSKIVDEGGFEIFVAKVPVKMVVAVDKKIRACMLGLMCGAAGLVPCDHCECPNDELCNVCGEH